MTSNAMLDRALADARASRLALYAALDELHVALQTIERQKEKLADMQTVWARCAPWMAPDDQ